MKIAGIVFIIVCFASFLLNAFLSAQDGNPYASFNGVVAFGCFGVALFLAYALGEAWDDL